MADPRYSTGANPLTFRGHLQVSEPVGVQTFRSEAAFERFDVGCSVSTGTEVSPDVGSPALLVLFRPSRELAGDPGPLGHTSTV